jgi:hypothetical protein
MIARAICSKKSFRFLTELICLLIDKCINYFLITYVIMRLEEMKYLIELFVVGGLRHGGSIHFK